ncbi:MAG: AbgT family transporter [Lachnospiraceae bacterium]|nr:AbgT family transporter [Lachnospiraceae bacterium]
MNQKTVKKEKMTWFAGFLNGIETVGNRLPHPITMFALLAAAVVLISGICAMFGVSATGEMVDSKTMEVSEQTISVVSLMNREGLAYMLTHAVSNFTGFAPLGVVLVTMLGVGCAEGSGYLTALMKKAVSVTPAAVVTPMLVFLGVMSNVASDIGYVVLIPIGAVVFMAYGRHPLAGLAAAFAGVSGGFSANLLIGTLDPMLAGISTEAAHMVDPGYTVGATANWYFMIVSTFLIVLIGTLVTDRIVEPRLSAHRHTDESVDSQTALSEQERRALRLANLTLFGFVTLVAVLALPQNSFLRNPETGSLMSHSPFMSGLIVLISLLFFLPSVVYGRVSGNYKSEKDVCSQLGANMASMGSYIALAFVASQFIGYFNYTKLGTVLALKGAEVLGNSGVSGPVLMVCMILFSAAINLLMGSASAKWTILAPVFVPMFMLLGYSPELTQVAYRIGDSCTNLITPLMTYFAMVVVFAKKYDERSGIGTLTATMLPYSIFFLIGWSALLVVWMLFGLPLGPGAVLRL